MSHPRLELFDSKVSACCFVHNDVVLSPSYVTDTMITFL